MLRFTSTLCRSVRPLASTRWSFLLQRASSSYSTSSAIPNHSRILAVQLKERELSLEWNNNSSVNLPYVFLRDNCQEPESFHHSARRRHLNQDFTIDLNIQAKQADVEEDGQQLAITWPDGHISRYESAWLAKYGQGKHNMSGQLGVEKVYWGSDFYPGMPRFDYVKLMEDDHSLLEYLIALETHGLVLVDNVGRQSNQGKHLCNRIYYPKPTVYGKNVIKVETRPDLKHLFFTCAELYLHNDFVFIDYTNGVSMLHSVHQAPGPTGGASRFSDGVNVAKELKDTNPMAFDMLSQYPIQFVESGTELLGEFDTESWHYPIRADKNGDVTGVAYNNYMRGPHFSHTLMDKLHEWYSAYSAFSHLLHSPKFMMELKLMPGQMIVSDNTRVLHGRTEYHLNSDDYRCMEVWCMDWDELRSKARVLMKKLS